MKPKEVEALINDLMEEMSYPANFEATLCANPECVSAFIEIVHKATRRRFGADVVCGADDQSLLYKFCRYRMGKACTLRTEQCNFQS